MNGAPASHRVGFLNLVGRAKGTAIKPVAAFPNIRVSWEDDVWGNTFTVELKILAEDAKSYHRVYAIIIIIIIRTTTSINNEHSQQRHSYSFSLRSRSREVIEL
jgi:hypothetical protein